MNAPPESITARLDSIATRLERSRTDLARIIRDGPAPRAWLPASEGLFLRGKRHLIAAPAKSGKSLAMLSHAVEMALQGGRVAVLDRENGRDENALRLASILHARRLEGPAAQLVTERIAHFNYPDLSLRAAQDPSYSEHLAGFDLVILDSSRAFLTALDLDEDSSNDYGRFMGALIEPLHRAGIATLILDNAGHEGKRARGSSAKLDLNEVVFRLAQTAPFGENLAGSVRLTRTHTRFGGGRDKWHMTLGDGIYTPWQGGPTPSGEEGELREAAVAILTKSERPLGVHKVIAAMRERGLRFTDKRCRDLLNGLAADAASPVVHSHDGFAITSGAATGGEGHATGGQVIPINAAQSR